MTGWGISSEEPLELPEVLQVLKVEIVPVENCGITKSNQPEIYDSLVCVKSKKDSGVCNVSEYKRKIIVLSIVDHK